MQTLVTYADEKTLLQALHVGDTDAYEQVVRSHANRLLGLAFNRLNDRAAAEDTVQNLFADLWEKRQRITITTTLEGYLNAALRNRIFNQIAQQKLHQRAMMHLADQMDHIEHSVLEILAEKDLRRSLSEVVASLPENMQKIFYLRGEDYTLKEIAEALGLAEQTVKSYSAELTRRVRNAVAASYPDRYAHYLLAILSLLTKN